VVTIQKHVTMLGLVYSAKHYASDGTLVRIFSGGKPTRSPS